MQSSAPRSSVVKRSIVIGGHKTSVSLEDVFWNALKDIAIERRVAMAALIDAIDKNRASSNLSSAVRQYVMQHFYELAQVKTAPASGIAPAALLASA